MQCKLQDMEIKYRVLKARCDKRLHTNVEFLQEKRLKEIKQKEMDCKLQNIEKHNKTSNA